MAYMYDTVGSGAPALTRSSGGSMSPSRAHEAADVRWAWSADRSKTSNRRRSELDASAARGPDNLDDDMLEVVKLLSTATAQAQTDEPSFTQTVRSVHTDEAGNRGIGIQAGTTARHQNASTQVNENDVADVPESAAYDDEVLGRGDDGGASPHEQSLLNPRSGGYATSVGCGSTHMPHSAIPADRYPAFVNDARALGVCNRYGFISMPRPPVELPPRRRIKAICPADYPHLYGTHDLQLEEGASNRINRAHNLWVMSSGFVPKF
uniref:Uncharacterized protein n=1 Tax=Neobodo designis TaxID=312471 RepID=A0A7S1KZL4_NEODS